MDRIAAGVVEIDTAGFVSFSNAGMSKLFGGLNFLGKRLADAFEEGEKSGVLKAGTRSRLETFIASRERHCLFEMRDTRRLLATFHEANTERELVEFTDVSEVILTTLSEQRDVLTGLPNRLELLRRLGSVKTAAASDAGAALLYIDLDRFKMVNDTLGHPVGDALLKLVTERMAKLIGPGDVLACLGGDEFAILQTNCQQPRGAETLAMQIIELVSRTYLIQGHSVQVGVSVGIALAATDGNTPDELIKNSDLALFKAKSEGRGTFRFFTDAMDQELQARRSLEIDLRRALALQEFSLVYQPQFEIEGTRLVGFEALLRWSTPERGNVSPAEFIPLAEEIGIIGALGEWVLRTACAEACQWPETLTVSVNLSPLQFRSSNLIAMIVSALAATGLAGSRLELEITEGALMEDTDAVIVMLKQIKAMGIKVSMDDFGTGYSSLSYLQKFPFDKIKIDQSFIRSLETSPDSAAIVRAVTALGDSLGMVTIAEGVETENQLLQIAKDGCKQVQGFLTGRPLPSNAVTALIKVNIINAKG